MEFSLFRRSKN